MPSSTIRIELERENAVYFPGETVRGKVRLNLLEPTTASVFLDFQAKASTEWIDESDEGKRVLTGETVFQHQVLTLFGSVYQTGALRTTGEKAGANFLGEAIDFDRTAGVGTVYIPCEEREKKTLKLKLWTIGCAAEVDATKLVEEKGIRSQFLLSTTGHMTKGPVKLSGKFVPYKDIFPEGEDPRPLCFVLQIHQLKSVPPKTKNVSIRITRENDERTALPEGDTVLPFQVKLRDDGPGSTYWQHGDNAGSSNVSYSLKAFVDLDKKDPRHGIIITVLPNRPLPRAPLLSPYQMETGDQPLSKFGCLCMPRGATFAVSVKLSLSRLVYSPGEVIDMTGSQVINNSKVPQPAQVVLRCFISQTVGYGATRTINQDYVLYETVIPEKQKVVLTNLPDYHLLRVPPLPPSYSGQYLSIDKTKVNSACLRFSYTLEIRLVEWGNGFFSRTPILISAAPPYSHKLQELRFSRSDPELTDPWSIFKQALSGPKDNGMAPTLKGTKGISKLVRAEESDPIWMGEMCDYEEWMRDGTNRDRLKKWREGAKDDSELEQLLYWPVVNTFVGPSIARESKPAD